MHTGTMNVWLWFSETQDLSPIAPHLQPEVQKPTCTNLRITKDLSEWRRFLDLVSVAVLDITGNVECLFKKKKKGIPCIAYFQRERETVILELNRHKNLTALKLFRIHCYLKNVMSLLGQLGRAVGLL